MTAMMRLVAGLVLFLLAIYLIAVTPTYLQDYLVIPLLGVCFMGLALVISGGK